jgi:hypothetical protein
MKETLSPELQRLLDLQAIRDCLGRYSRGLDRHDEEILRSVFHEDAVDHHGSFLGGLDEFVISANEGHEATWSAHTHLISTNTVDFDGPDLAHSEAYVLWVLNRSDGDGVDMGGGRYLDRFERREGEWRIAQRELIVDWWSHCESRDFGDVTSYPNGTWDRTDPSYRRPYEFTVSAAAEVAS